VDTDAEPLCRLNESAAAELEAISQPDRAMAPDPVTLTAPEAVFDRARTQTLEPPLKRATALPDTLTVPPAKNDVKRRGSSSVIVT
jgi:hypothetical protein